MMKRLREFFRKTEQDQLNREINREAYRGNFELVEERLDSEKADVNYVGPISFFAFEEGRMPRKLPGSKGRHTVSHVSSWYAMDAGTWNVGFSAIAHKNLPLLEKLLDKGLDPSLNLPGDPKQSLLVYAIRNHFPEAALLLVERGADYMYPKGQLHNAESLARAYGMTEVTAAIEKKQQVRMNEKDFWVRLFQT